MPIESAVHRHGAYKGVTQVHKVAGGEFISPLQDDRATAPCKTEQRPRVEPL